jgi:hypothetical protein
VVEPLQLPEIPPEGPWSAYVLVVIWLPLLLRVLFLLFPFRRAIARLAPHAGWAFKALRELPIRGIGLLVTNEIIAFTIPPLVVFTLRVFFDPVGWQSWSDVPTLGYFILLLFVGIWLVLDFLRIARVRRMLKAIEKHDIERMQKLADAGMKTRKWLRRFSGRDKRKQSDEHDAGSAIAKSSARRWGRRVLLTRKISPAGLLGSVALSASVELAKSGAGKLSDAVDSRLQKEFDNIAQTNTKTLMILLVRDLLMGVVPVLALAALPVIL